jgi:hypothetical protein
MVPRHYSNIVGQSKQIAPLRHPEPDEPEPSRCMMTSQKIEVGHTLKSKNAAAFLVFKPSGTGPRTSVPII